MARRLLIVSYLFPPCGGIGVQRVLAYTRYLPLCGVQPIILTARYPVTALYDRSLLDQVPGDTPVYRAFNPEVPSAIRRGVRSLLSKTKQLRENSSRDTAPRPTASAKPFSRWSPIDPQASWVSFATRAAINLMKSHSIDSVLVNVPPYSGLQIGIALKQRFPTITLINDFRDEWLSYTIGVHNPGISPSRLAHSKALERQAVNVADYTVTVTGTWRDEIRNRYPDQREGKFLYVPNGYDPEEFHGLATSCPSSGRLVVAYSGSLYADSVYSVAPFFEALAGLPAELREKLEIRLMGQVERGVDLPEWIPPAVRVDQLGFVSHKRVIAEISTADCLLLIFNTKVAHSGKVFEYLATGRPILALTPQDGEVAKLIRATNAGWCVDVVDLEGIRNVLTDLIQRKQRGDAPRESNWSAIRAYERPRLVASLVQMTGLGVGLPGEPR